MKRKLAAILLISTILLSGCSSKGLTSSKASDNGSAGTINAVSNQNKADSNSGNSVSDSSGAKKLQPGTVSQLTGVQKAQVNVKLGSTINKLDESLKSIQDAKDVDLSSVN